MENEKKISTFASKANALVPIALVAGAVAVFSVAMIKDLQESNLVRDTIQTLLTGSVALARGGKDDE